MSPHFFLFRFWIWWGFKNKSDVCHVLCDELFMLGGRPHIAMLMLKQKFDVVSLILLVYKLLASIKYFFSIFRVSRDRERSLTASVRHFILCGILLERLFPYNSESITAAHVRDHSTAKICSVQKRNWLCCNVGCHVFRNRQRIT